MLDTNALLHYQPVGQLPWKDLARSVPVPLIIPCARARGTRCQEVLPPGGVHRRAQAIIRDLDKLIVPTGGFPAQLAEGVTIKVPVSMPNPEIGRRTADQEILADAAEFKHMSGQPVAIVTGDIAMRLRATLLGPGYRRLGRQSAPQQDQPH